MNELNEYFKKNKIWICEGHIGNNNNQVIKTY